MRTSYLQMLGRCLQWAGPTSIRGAEWFYSGLGSVVVYAAAEAAKNYADVEVAFANPLIQAAFSFVIASVLVFILRITISPFALWMSDIKSLTKLTRSQRDMIEIKNRQLEELRLDRPRLVARMEKIIYRNASKDGEPTFCFMIVSVYNLGNRPSIAEGFSMRLEMGDKIFRAKMSEFGGKISLGSSPDENGDVKVQVYESKDAIYKKTATPITSGNLARGFVMGLFPPNQVVIQNGMTAIVACEDIFGEIIECSYKISQDEAEAWDTFTPGMEMKHTIEKSGPLYQAT